MIKEFAFDPECAPNLDVFRRVVDQCAFHLGRIISDFPRSSWAVMVLNHLKPQSFQEKQQLTETLIQLKHRGGLRDMGRRYGNETWIINALREHANRPFHCIITGPDASNHAKAVDIGQLVPNTTHWYVETEDRIPRTADRIVECVLPLIRESRELLIVDPHLTPDTARYRQSIRAILEGAHLGGKTYARIEVHAKVCCDSRANQLQRQQWIQQFEKDCQSFLPREIPFGRPLCVFLWDEVANGDEFHVRLVLTELGGIRIDKGIDIGDATQTTDVGLVSPGVYHKRWADFQRGATTFDLKREIKLIGTRR